MGHICINIYLHSDEFGLKTIIKLDTFSLLTHTWTQRTKPTQIPAYMSVG